MIRPMNAREAFYALYPRPGAFEAPSALIDEVHCTIINVFPPEAPETERTAITLLIDSGDVPQWFMHELTLRRGYETMRYLTLRCDSADGTPTYYNIPFGTQLHLEYMRATHDGLRVQVPLIRELSLTLFDVEHPLPTAIGSCIVEEGLLRLVNWSASLLRMIDQEEHQEREAITAHYDASSEDERSRIPEILVDDARSVPMSDLVRHYDLPHISDDSGVDSMDVECPFCDGNNALHIGSTAYNIYKCFGCGKAGNPITFVMDHDGVSFTEAVSFLLTTFKQS